MKRSSIRSSIIGSVFAAGLSVVPFAAIPSAQQAVPKAKIDTVVMTGCVAAGSGASDYVLNNARAEAVASTSPNIMHSAPAADMSKDDQPVSYALKGGEMKAHVGHKVAVTGTMDDAKAGEKTDQPVGSAGSAAAGAPTGMAASARTFNVQSVKMIAASCS
jgi:hypothetical protein